MKVKEIDRIATVAWSPKELENIYIAAGTAAGQLDSNFSTTAALEVYQWNVNEPGLDVPVKSTYNCENKFHKIVWGCYGHGTGAENGEHPSGIIVGGCDGGIMHVYSAAKLMANEEPIVLTKSKHTGAVKALDFNFFRSNLVASGATDSEIFIWDLNNAKVPMSPGAKIQPADEVTDLEWNKQVEHILATTFSTRCVVWDLRKNEPVIKVSDTTSRIKYKSVKWHPEVATQMCLASEDDTSPVIQLWDLRYATSPLKVIQGHQRGILGMSWCPQDSDILVSCGKDSRIICFNPNYAYAGYEMTYEIPTSSQWSFDVAFCPKNPLIISSCSLDGRVTIYGLSGGAQLPVTTSKLADSFPGMDMSMSHAPVPTQPTAPQQLRDPPKWMKRPAGASFAFGGRLVSFQNIKTASTQPGQPDKVTGSVTVAQVVTLPALIERSKKLEEALEAGHLESYCSEKAKLALDTNESRVWEFLQASFSQNPRQAFASLLGYSHAEITAKLQKFIPTDDVNNITSSFGGLGHTNSVLGDVNKVEPNLQNGFVGIKSEYVPEFDVPTDDTLDGRINQAIISGNIDIAVNMCLDSERWTDALLLATKGNPDLLVKVQMKYFEKRKSDWSANMIRAVVRNDLGHLVSNCKLDSWKQVLATALTYADDIEFKSVAEKLGNRLSQSQNTIFLNGALLCFICSGSLNQLVDAWLGDSDNDSSSSPDKLQDVVEQVMILKKAADMWGRDSKLTGDSLAGKLREYASLLVSQGCVTSALTYLKDLHDPSTQVLKERLQLSLGYTPTRQSRVSLTARSRQSSESSGGLRSLSQRPSHPLVPVSRSSTEMYDPASNFRNLTGPIVPPPSGAPIQTYNQPPPVATGVYNPTQHIGQPSQFSPALPPHPPPAGMGYQKQEPSMAEAPAKLVTTTAPPPTLFNPAEAAKEMLPPQPEELTQRKSSAGALPRPPVSNVASGWNDPPPIMLKSKTTQAQLSSQKLITHPIFGTNPDPVQPATMAGGPGASQPLLMASGGLTGAHQPPPPMGMANSGMSGAHQPPPPMANIGMPGALQAPPMANSGMPGALQAPPMSNSGMSGGVQPPPMMSGGMPGMPQSFPMSSSGIPGAPPTLLQNPNATAYGGPASMPPPPPPTAAAQPYHPSAVAPPPMVGQGVGQGMAPSGAQWW